MTKDEPIKAKKFDDDELRTLNLFFGLILVVLSIYVILSLTVNAELMMISVSFLIIGAAFTCIGIADKDQPEKQQNITILFGFIVTVVGLIVFFNISFIMEYIVMQMMLLITNVVLGIAGFVAISAVSSENWTVPRSRRIMILMGGAPIFGASLINIVLLIFGFVYEEDYTAIISILLFVALLLHGLTRIVIYYTGIYE